MIKKNRVRAFMMIFAFQISAGAMINDKAEKFSDKHAGLRVKIDNNDKIASQKKYDKRKLWIIAGGVAVVSLVVGAAAVALYCRDKVDKLTDELDKADDLLINLDGDHSNRVSVTQKRIEELNGEIAKLEFESYSEETQRQINRKNVEKERLKSELKLVYDIEKSKTSKKIAKIDKQIRTLQSKEDFVYESDSPEVQKLQIEIERERLSLEKYGQTLFNPGDQDWQKVLKEEEDRLNQRERKLNINFDENNSVHYSSESDDDDSSKTDDESEGDKGFGIFD